LPKKIAVERELRWITPPKRLIWAAPSRALRSWLLDTSSLTAKLQKLSGGKLRVQLLRQVQGRASRTEAQALGIALQQRCLVREVILQGGDQAWVFARSVLPLCSLTGSLRRLRKQGTKPLGAFLFSQPHLMRGPIALSFISRHHGYLPESLIGQKSLWGRRSIFSLEAKPLVVSEVFLPNFVDLIARSQT
jgi:chorismate--pyruvate lyase